MVKFSNVDSYAHPEGTPFGTAPRNELHIIINVDSVKQLYRSTGHSPDMVQALLNTIKPRLQGLMAPNITEALEALDKALAMLKAAQ